MNLIDRAIGYISPASALRRRVARDFLNSYQDGIPNRLGTTYSDPLTSMLGNYNQRNQKKNMRHRAINADENNPLARALLNTETDNIVAEGFNLQAKTDSKEFNTEAEVKWHEWLEKADIRGMFGRVDIQRLPYRMGRRDGDVGIVLVADGLESRLQIVPADMIDSPFEQPVDANPMVSGIQFDQYGSPIAFSVKQQIDAHTPKYTKIPSRDFVFICNTVDPVAARGETCFATIFDLLDQLDNYVDALVIAARMGAIFGLIFREATGSKQFAGLPSLINGNSQQQKALTLENGLVKYIGNADDIVQVQAQQPMNQSSDFIRSMLRLIGIPFDMPLEIIAKDMSTANFASARIGLLQYYRSARIKQARYAAHWSRIYRWWLSRERAKQLAGAENAMMTPFPEMFWDHAMIPRGWPYTDPVSEAQGDLLAIEIGKKSPQEVAAEAGGDYTENQRLKEEAGWPTDAPKSSMTRDSIKPDMEEPDSTQQPDDGQDDKDDDDKQA